MSAYIKIIDQKTSCYYCAATPLIEVAAFNETGQRINKSANPLNYYTEKGDYCYFCIEMGVKI